MLVVADNLQVFSFLAQGNDTRHKQHIFVTKTLTEVRRKYFNILLKYSKECYAII